MLQGRPFLKLLLMLVAAAATGEVAARVADLARGTDSSVVPLPDPATSIVVPHPYVGWIHRPDFASGPAGATGNYTTNSLGFRGPQVVQPKPPGTFRIACLGGSTTSGDNKMHDDQTWPAQLAALLQRQLPPGSPYTRVEAINGGAGHYTSMESLIALKMLLLPLDLDLVVTYSAANDAQVIQRAGFKPDYSHARRSWSEPPPRPLFDRLLGWSHFYGLFLDQERRLGPRYIKDRVFVDGYAEMPLLPISELEPGIETFYWTQRELVGVVRAHGLPVTLCTFAWPRTGRFAPSAQSLSEGYIAVVRQLNAVTRAVAAIDDVPLVDIERLGPADSKAYIDDVHSTVEGYGEIARLVADSIVAQGLLRRPPHVAELPPAVLRPPPELEARPEIPAPAAGTGTGR